jgi:hypothetical protein
MIKPPALLDQMVQNTLTNHLPVPCAICDRLVATFDGLPVILDNKAPIIEFAHPGCCARDE